MNQTAKLTSKGVQSHCWNYFLLFPFLFDCVLRCHQLNVRYYFGKVTRNLKLNQYSTCNDNFAQQLPPKIVR